MAYIGSKPAAAVLTASDITDGIVTTAKIADSSVTTEKIVADTNFRNIIINGDMSIAQRGTSATGITTSTYNTIDRLYIGASSAGTWTQSQSTDVPTGQGFATSAKMDCTTANTSLGSSARLQITQYIEGQNLQYLKKGTSSAESITLSFWVKSNKTGTYICELLDADNSNRHINKSYTISSADTWEKKTITYDGDTTGAFNNDANRSLDLNFWLVAGSTFTSGTLQTSWGANTSANRAVGQVNLADSTSNEWYVTGVQLEAGTSASDFEFLPVDVNLERCMRYYEQSSSFGSTSQYHGQQVVFGSGGATFSASTSSAGGRQFRCWKRATPTVTLYHQDGTSGALYTIYNAAKVTGVAAQHLNENGFLFANKSSAFGQGLGYYYSFTADAEL